MTHSTPFTCPTAAGSPGGSGRGGSACGSRSEADEAEEVGGAGAGSSRHGGSGGLGGGSVNEISTQCGTRNAAESAGNDAVGGMGAVAAAFGVLAPKEEGGGLVLAAWGWT